jgi:N-acetylglucosamine-6-phosphate deacetylase
MSQNFKAGGALDGIFELGPKLYGEIICDLKHVHPRWVNTFINCFSMEKVLGVSDAVHYAGAGLKDGTVIRGCEIRDNALWVAGKANTLAGSMSPLNLQFNNVINLFTSDRKAYFELKTPAPDPLDRALIKACRMYALNPAELFREDGEIGSLEKGKRADVIIAEISGKPGAYRLKLEKVLIAGEQAA